MGFFSWIASRPKGLLNYGKKVVGTEEIKKNADFIVDMASSLPSKSKRFETFDSAYSRLGLTEEKLVETYKYYTTRFNIFFSFFGLGLVFLVYNLIQGSWAVFATIGFLMFCLAQLFIASFRMYQIRRRELAPPIEWLRDPKEWWVKPFKPLKMSKDLKPVSPTRVQKRPK